jgi:hypothetical protein
MIIFRILKSCKGDLLKAHINFILCFCNDNFIKINISKTIATYFSRKTRVQFMSLTYTNVVQSVFTVLKPWDYLMIINFNLTIIFSPHSLNPLSSLA